MDEQLVAKADQSSLWHLRAGERAIGRRMGKNGIR
jgi:hypothetical protein